MLDSTNYNLREVWSLARVVKHSKVHEPRSSEVFLIPSSLPHSKGKENAESESV